MRTPIVEHLTEAKMSEICKNNGFLSKEAGRLAGGVPQRTLQSWTEKGLILPSIKDTSGTGSRRLYGPENIKEISAYRIFLEEQKKARKEYEAEMKRTV